MKAFFLSLILFIHITGLAQSPAWAWAKSAGGGGSTFQNLGQSVTTDSHGNSYATGYFQCPHIAFGNFTLLNSNQPWGGNRDIFIVKYDPWGHVLWVRSAGGHSADWAGGIATDHNDNVYVTGIYAGSITFGNITLTNNQSNWSSMFLVKYDAAGNAIWARSAGGLSYAIGYNVSTDTSGNVYVAGHFNCASLTFGNTTLINSNNTMSTADIFIVKFSSTGNILWAKSAGGPKADAAYGLCTDIEGNTFITGYFMDSSITFGNTTLINPGNNTADVFVVKYDTAGNVIWARSAGGALNEEGYGICSDATGNVYVTGYFRSDSILFDSLTLHRTTNAGSTAFIAKMDLAGNFIWARAEGNVNGAEGHSVALDAEGNVFMSGIYYYIPITLANTTFPNAGVSDVFIIQYDSTGNIRWAKTFGGNRSDWVSKIASDPAGNMYITGWFQSSTMHFGTTVLTFSGIQSNYSNFDFYIARLGKNVLETGISSFQTGSGIFVAPNPSSGLFSISGINFSSRINVFNVLGEEVYSSGIADHETIDLSNKPKGIYFVRLSSPEGATTKKIVIQ